MENLHFLKITDKVNIPVPLTDDTQYQFTGTISTYGADKRSNQDGTQSYTYKAKFDDEVFLVKGEQVIPAKDKKTWSQKWRRLVTASGLDYDEFQAWMFTRFDDLKEEFETR